MDPFVGRAAERAALAGWRAAAADGPARVALVTGEAGVGKTTLLVRAADDARAAGAEVVWARCFDGDGAAPLAPWRDALGDAVEQAPLAAADTRTRVHDAVTRQLLARAPGALIVFEDAHWADADSLAVLCHVVRAAARGRWLLVITVRDPDALDELLDELIRDGSPRLALRGFSRDELDAYAEATAGQRLPLGIAELILDETGGNALYVREVLRHLLEERALVERDGRLATDRSLDALRTPDGVRQVVRRRAARLGAATRALLERAALLDGPASATALAAATGAPLADTLDAIDEATRAGLLRATARGGHDFTHAIVRRALRDDLPPARRAAAHLAIARALTALGDAVDPAVIAAQHHAAFSLGLTDGASDGVPFALDAARRARAAGAHARSVELLRRALDLAGSSSRDVRADVGGRLALACAEAHLPDAAVAALADAAADTDDDAALAARTADVARELRAGGAPRASWVPLVERGLALVGDARDLTWARLAVLRDDYEPLATGELNIGRWLGVDPDAIARLRADGSEDDVADTVDPHAWRSADETAALTRRARAWRSPAATLKVLEACGRDLFFRRLDLAGALALMEEIRELAERVGSLRGQASALTVTACARGVLGDLPGARRDQAAVAEIAQRLGAMHRMNVIGPTAIRLVLGYIGGADDWPARIADALRFAGTPEAGRTPFGIVAAGLSTFGLGQAGDRERGPRLARIMVDVVSAAPPTMVEHGAARDCTASAIWELGLVELAPRLLALAEDAAGCAIAGAAPMSCHELSAARLAALLGERDRAARWFDAARTALERRGQAPIRAICDLDEARAWAGHDDARAAALLDAADAAFARLGLDAWRARVAAARAGRPDGLTPREVEVLGLLAAGRSNKEIASRLFVSVPTVERHIANIYDKIGARGRAAATAYALRHGIAALA